MQVLRIFIIEKYGNEYFAYIEWKPSVIFIHFPVLLNWDQLLKEKNVLPSEKILSSALTISEGPNKKMLFHSISIIWMKRLHLKI